MFISSGLSTGIIVVISVSALALVVFIIIVTIAAVCACQKKSSRVSNSDSIPLAVGAQPPVSGPRSVGTTGLTNPVYAQTPNAQPVTLQPPAGYHQMPFSISQPHPVPSQPPPRVDHSYYPAGASSVSNAGAAHPTAPLAFPQMYHAPPPYPMVDPQPPITGYPSVTYEPCLPSVANPNYNENNAAQGASARQKQQGSV